MSKQEVKGLISGLLFISPWIAGFLLFTLYPIAQSFYFSLTEFNVIRPPVFIGFQNYVNLFNDPIFWTSLRNTMYMIVFGVTSTIFTALCVAILLNHKKLKGLSFFRVVFFVPTLMPLIINCILWLWLLQPNDGLINSVLGIIGIPGPPWFASPLWSRPALILMMIWGSGGAIIIFLAGLQEIPETLYESAQLDGANFLQMTLRITVPMLSPIILFNTVMMVIGVFQYFAEPLIMTEGGPNNSTLFYSLYLYQNAFRFFRMGYASAMAWILLIIALSIILLLFKGLGRFKID